MNAAASLIPLEPTVYRVLVVDDNPAIHSDFRKILSPQRPGANATGRLEAILFDEAPAAPEVAVFELDSAHQGQEALEMLRTALAAERPYALAFVDVRMPPGWDGIETVCRLWEVYPRLQVVLCTAYSDYSWQEIRARLGRPDSLVVLKKPFDNIEVQQLAHALTRKWELNLQAALKLEQLEVMVRRRTRELELAHAELASSEERLAKAFHTCPVALAIQSLPDRRLVEVNAPLCQLFGHTREELLGEPGTRLLEGVPDVSAWYEQLARREAVQNREWAFTDARGGRHQVLVSLAPITLAGQPHALLVLQDLTERHRLEQQLRQAHKLEAIGQLAAGVAHDFNNLLTIIQAHAELLAGALPEDGPEAGSVREITRATSRATHLVRQLLSFGRKQPLQLQYLDLNAVVRSTLGMIRRLVGETVQLRVHVEPQLPTVHADLALLEQCLLNLASNARDALPNGGEIEIRTAAVTVQREAVPLDPVERQGRYVRLTFRDTGCGMEPDALNHLFEPFYTTKEVGKGTGLGLASVFGIVRQHGGWIEVRSQPGQGTAFELFFPATDKPADPPSVTPPIDQPPQRGRETILVAEDEDALREMVALVLTQQGYSVLVATSGVEALEVYEKARCPIDLLLTDIVMPGGIMGGELARRLRSFNPHLKVIFTSGFRASTLGMDTPLERGESFLPKPYSIHTLTRLVREVLDRVVPVN